MLKPPRPLEETQRLRALQMMQVLDTPADERLDRITRMVRKLLDVPIALVSLVDRDRQWFKSRQGLEATETPREISFCGHAILQDELFVIEDTLKDTRFVDNPLVTDNPNIRFYAGCPLTADSGHRIGTLCVIDSKPRTLSAGEREWLRDFGQLAQQQLRSIALATTDELTKISNRRGFYQLAEKGLAIARRTGTSSVLLSFDLNGFKQINDQFGHEAGDAALIQFARCLLLSCREADAVGRTGGDEFCLFMPNTQPDGVKVLTGRLQEWVDQVNASGRVALPLRFSVGMAIADPAVEQDLDTLLAQADEQMYADKQKDR